MLQIIQNDPEVPPGNLIENLDELGICFQLHHPYRGEPLPEQDGIKALIVLGGAMGANDGNNHPFLAPLKQLICTSVERGVPYLGICLGGQLLSAALGATVVSCRWEELGIVQIELNEAGMSDPLFAGISSPFTTFQWHHDSFDLPDNAMLLASSPACRHQAFRVGSNAWGLQFHPEINAPIIRDWSAWDPATACRTEELVASFQQQQSAYCHTARLILANFIQTADLLH